MVFGVDDLFAAYENIMDNKYPISITKFTIPEMINFQLSSVLTHFDHRFSKELCNFNTQDNIAVIWNSNGIEIINSYFFADQQSVSDTYLAAWNTIPPRRPNFLNAFLAKMTRRISIDRWRKLSAKKRGGGEIILALDELEECVDTHNVETELAKKELTRVLNAFLSSLQETERNVFLCRYWYLDSIQTISEVSGFSQSKVTSMLHRLRGKLRKTLSEEGYV